MLPAWEVIDYPVIKVVRDCYVCKLTGKTDSIKSLWEIKGDDMNIVIRLKKLGEEMRVLSGVLSEYTWQTVEDREQSMEEHHTKKYARKRIRYHIWHGKSKMLDKT